MSLRKVEVILLIASAISILAFALARTVGAQATVREDMVNRTIRPSVAFWGEDIDVELVIDAATLPQPATGVDIVPLYVALAIDRSGSMSGRPLVEARNSASDFVDLMNLTKDGDAVTVIAFDDTASVAQSMTQDRQQAIRAIQSFGEGGGTDIAAGLLLAVQQFQKDPAPADAQQLLILLSDGVSDASAAISAADTAKAQGLRVVTIALGDADRATLARIASSPDDYYETADPAALLGIYSDIAATLVGSVAHDVSLTEYFNDVDFTLVNQPYRAGSDGNLISWQLPFVGRNGRSVGYLLSPEKMGRYPVSPTAGQMELSDINNQIVAQPTPVGPSALVIFPVWVLFVVPAITAAWFLIRLLSALLQPRFGGVPAERPKERTGDVGKSVTPEKKKAPSGKNITHNKVDRPPSRK